MKLAQLEIFLEVSRLGSISQAGRNLNLTQQAVSASIRHMERELDTVLLARAARGVTLTAAGEHLRAFAIAVLLHYKELKKRLREEHAPGLAGELHVYVNNTFYLEKLFFIVERFCAHFPEVKVSTSAHNFSDICARLLSPAPGRVHRIGLLNLPADAAPPEGASGLSFHPLTEGSYQACMATAHPLAQSRRVSLKRLLREPLVLGSAGEPAGATLYRLLSRHGKPNIVLATTSLNVWSHSIARNLGIGFLQDTLLDGSEPFRSSLKGIVTVPVMEEMRAVTGYLVSGDPGEIIRAFVSFLPETLERRTTDEHQH